MNDFHCHTLRKWLTESVHWLQSYYLRTYLPRSSLFSCLINIHQFWNIHGCMSENNYNKNPTDLNFELIYFDAPGHTWTPPAVGIQPLQTEHLVARLTGTYQKNNNQPSSQQWNMWTLLGVFRDFINASLILIGSLNVEFYRDWQCIRRIRNTLYLLWSIWRLSELIWRICPWVLNHGREHIQYQLEEMCRMVIDLKCMCFYSYWQAHSDHVCCISMSLLMYRRFGWV
jgi:hypothetical protein